jgi:hypothetical protein
MTPVRWWDYPILAATAILTAVWAALPGGLSTSGYRTSSASLLGALAVGCPLCNKLVVALLGLSGALAVWAPLQPVLGVASVGLVLLAVITKWRLSGVACPTAPDHRALDRSPTCLTGEVTVTEPRYRRVDRLGGGEDRSFWPMEGFEPSGHTDEPGVCVRSRSGDDPSGG